MSSFFPLNIPQKQDLPENSIARATIGEEYFFTASEFNNLVGAAQELLRHGTGYSPGVYYRQATVVYNNLQYLITSDSYPFYSVDIEQEIISGKFTLSGSSGNSNSSVVLVDDLLSMDSTKALTANQGFVLKGLYDSLVVLLSSDDTALDDIQELVDFIKVNKATLDTLSIGNIAGLQTALDNLVTHTNNNDIHVTASEKSKYNNHTKDWFAEELTAEMGAIYRYYNGNIWEYIGQLPFNTVDLKVEILNNLWYAKISAYPAAEFVTISPPQISINITRFIQVDGSNLKQGTTIYLGENITIISYIYVSDNRMLVEVQSNGILSSVKPMINNGIEVTLEKDFSISEGELFIPDSIGTPWETTSTSVIYGVGNWEQQLTGALFIGYFSSGIDIANDCEFSFYIEDLTATGRQFYTGFKIDLTAVGANNGTDGAVFRLFPENNAFGMNNSTTGINLNSILSGSKITFKRIKQTSSSCIIEILQNDVLVHTTGILNVTAAWYPYFYSYSANKVSSVQLLIN